MRRTFTVVVQKDVDGGFASVPELPGCHTQGDTLEELRAHVREAIALYLEGEDFADFPVGLERVEVEG